MGRCVDGECASVASDPDSGAFSGGAGGTTGVGTAGTGTVGAGNAGMMPARDAGCSGEFVFVPDHPTSTGGTTSSGGAPSGPPEACHFDEHGFATMTLDELCQWYRCPSSALDIVSDLDCSEVAADDADGITLESGCGFDTVKVSGTGFTYEATFDATEGGLTSLGIQLDSFLEISGCGAYRFVAGQAKPECVDGVRRRCVRSADPPGGPVECREPAQAGCAACCTTWSSGTYSGCTVATSTGSAKVYDAYFGEDTACACNCPPCAQCTTEVEYNLRVLPEKPECDCPPVGTGGASGTGGAAGSGGSDATPCENHCNTLNSLRAVCPDVPR